MGNSKAKLADESLESLSSEKVFGRSNSLENLVEDSSEDPNSNDLTEDEAKLNRIPKSGAVKEPRTNSDIKFYDN